VLRSVRYCACLPRSTLPLLSSHLNSVHLQLLRHSPSDLRASFVHWAVSVPPLASPHQDPRSPCKRIRQPTPPGRQFSPTGALVPPRAPDCSQDQGPNKARLRKKSSSFFSLSPALRLIPRLSFLFPLIHLCTHHGFHGSSLARVSEIGCDSYCCFCWRLKSSFIVALLCKALQHLAFSLNI
jgi:hypothetical protein